MTIMVKKRYPTRRPARWTVAEAKAQFSEVVERARESGPQVVTRHGRAAAVVVSIDEWEQKTRRAGSLADFFAASPLRESGIDLERPRTVARDVDL